MSIAVEKYLKENIDQQITIHDQKEIEMIPIYLRDKYDFYNITIFDKTYLLLEVMDETPTIDQIRKHIERIEEIMSQSVIMYYRDISLYRRQSLIKHSIPFVVENGQMFLPFLGLDLKRVSNQQTSTIKSFSTATQIVFLHFLYHKESIINSTELAIKYGFTIMTASRALKELHRLKLVSYKTGGITNRSKEYQRIKDPEYFMKGREFLKSPVKKIVYTAYEPHNALDAGLSALAHQSMLNYPQNKVVAISSDSLKEGKIELMKNIDRRHDKGVLEVEVWSYDPHLFSNEYSVDTASLYASLMNDNDERIHQQLNEMMRSKRWYMD